MRENLEKQMMNVIYEGCSDDFGACTAMSEKCSIVARDYAKRFAEWCEKSPFIFNGRVWVYTDERIAGITTEKMMETFDSQNTPP